MSQSFEQGWQSGHVGVVFPFKEHPTAATSPVPDDLLVDLRLFLSAYTEVEIYLSELAYDQFLDRYSLTFSKITDNAPVLQGYVARRDISGASRVFVKQTIADGNKVCLFTPGPLWDTPSWGGTAPWTKSYLPNESAIETTQVIPGPQTLRRIFIDGEVIPPQEDWPAGVSTNLVGGYNVSFGFVDSRFNVPIPTQDLTDFAELNCGPGYGAGYPPNSTTIDYWARVNGLPISKDGNVTITANDCLRVSQPESEGQIIPNTLVLASDCQPCCACSEYRKVSRAEGRRSAKIKDLCDDIAASKTESVAIYNDAITAINQKRPPMVVVRNVRTASSSITFSVINTASVPLYGYVAINISNLSHPIGAITVSAPNVQNVPQPSGLEIYPFIDTHKATLPPLPFENTENPLGAFPTASFTSEYGHALLAVGQTDLNSAFSPIAPGSSVDVTMRFLDAEPAITAAIEAYNAGDLDEEGLMSATVPGASPLIKFRSVAVYGSSHCYACASETYQAQVNHADTSPDVIRTEICGVSMDNHFKITTLPSNLKK